MPQTTTSVAILDRRNKECLTKIRGSFPFGRRRAVGADADMKPGLEHDHVEHAMHMSHGMPPKTAAAHMGHDRCAGHSVAMFRDKRWLTLILTLPVAA